MQTYDFVTLDVFTDRRFGGNQLAVFPDAKGISDADMQTLAAELNLSETTFVLPPEDPRHTARVRIFNRSSEMPFAGHPNVGTGYLLAGLGRAKDDLLTFEELAGLVSVRVQRDQEGNLVGAIIDAPQALTLGDEFTPEQIAQCAGLTKDDILLTGHRPIRASVGVDFVIAEITPQALDRAKPDMAGFEAVGAGLDDFSMRLSLHLYARDGDGIRARMFSPLTGTFEDPATGSANATLGALLLSLTTEGQAAYVISQGVEMGRPSRLHVTARRTADGIRAQVGGGCVPVFRGQVTL
ncbi:MAG: phenazine biosynthesis protein PhzF [Phenylobacterium zucineum]|nr:MAG: phenazine biosynthesis protein PhzF [Phenylobacterium zucineum]